MLNFETAILIAKKCILMLHILDFENRKNTKFKFNSMGGSPGDVSEEPVTKKKRKKGWRMSYDTGEATEGLENEM